MFDRSLGRVSRLVFVAVIGILLSAPFVNAQTARTEPTPAAYRARLDTLLPLWRNAAAGAAKAERVRQHLTAAAVSEYKGLRFIADSAARLRVTAAAATVWPMIEETFGSDASTLIDHSILVEQRWNRLNSGDSGLVLNIGRLKDGVPQWRYSASVTDSTSSAEQLVGVLQVAAVQPLFDSLDAPLRAWLGQPLRAGGERERDLEAVFVALATWSAPIAQQCIAGELRGCRKVLGLTEADDPVVETMTAKRRHELVRSHSRALRVPGAEVEWDRCVRGHDDASCTRRLRTLSADQLRLSKLGQSSLVHFALAQGGADAHARLRSTASLPLDARLAAASGTSVDSLVMAWRTHVMSAQPSPLTLTPSAAVTAILYILGCGALAMRSSRWR
jgi:hypothetical protein